MIEPLKYAVRIMAIVFLLAGCKDNKPGEKTPPANSDSILPTITDPDTTEVKDTELFVQPSLHYKQNEKIETGEVSPQELLSFARTLIGTPYLYASTDPSKGLDCSGFITHVFNHFRIKVPRSSVDFTNVGREVMEENAGPGDLILFTGTDSTVRIVGHMGIVETNENGQLRFIHSTSGKANGVVITPLEKYYRGRFVKIIRIFPDKYFE